MQSIPKNIREILENFKWEYEDMVDYGGRYQLQRYEEFVDALDICIDVFKPYKVVYGSSDVCYCGRCLNSICADDIFCPYCKAEFVWEESE